MKWKFTIIVILLTILSINAADRIYQIEMTWYEREASNWCWAACCEMILYNYYIAYPLSDGTYLFPITQDSIASWGTGGANIGDVLFGSLNQGDSLSVEDIITYLNDIGTTAFGTAVNPIGMNPVNNPLSWSDLVSDITHGKPNIAATNKQSDNAHAVVILGIDSTKTGVYYWDPLNDPRTDTLLYYSYADMIDSPPYGIGSAQHRMEHEVAECHSPVRHRGGVRNRSEGFLFVKDNAGDLYCPYWGQDDLHYVQVGQGYQLYTNVPDTISVQGVPVNYANTPIALSSGWNMIAYLLPTIMGYESPTYAFASIDSSLILVKDNSGHVYWPSMGVDEIELIPGQGYRVLMNASASFSYPPFVAIDKRLASSSKPMLHLPKPRHYAIHAIPPGIMTTLLAKQVTIGGKLVPDSSEIGAFDASGSLVGSGTILKGVAAFVVWGQNPMVKQKMVWPRESR
jgi:hypothetical protein